MRKKDKNMEVRIFEAATEVFLEKGMDSARMQDIADRAGINKSLLNYYYRSKDRLFNTVFEMISIKMSEKFAPVLDKNLTAEEKLDFFFREHIAFFQKNPRVPLFLMNEINQNPERLKKIIDTLDYDKVISLFNTTNISGQPITPLTKESVLQLLTSIVAISVMPFAAKGILETVLEKFGVRFEDFVEQRKTFASEFVRGAIRNMMLT